MAILGIILGQSGTFTINTGAFPVGTNFVWSVTDTNVSVATEPGGGVAVATVSLSNTNTSFLLTLTITLPSTATEIVSATIPILPATATINQTA